MTEAASNLEHSTNTVTLGASWTRAREDALELIDRHKGAPDPEAVRLCELVFAAADSALTIALATRFDDAMSPSQFANGALHLTAYVDAAARLDGSDAWTRWPDTLEQTLAQFAEDSALLALFRFARAVETAVVVALGTSRTHGEYPPRIANLVVSEPHVGPKIEAWRDRALDEIRAHTLPSPTEWSGWKMRRDVQRVAGVARDELKRVVERVDSLKRFVREKGPARRSPTDVEVLCGWATTLEAIGEDPKFCWEYAHLNFQPTSEADAALMRLSAQFPYIVKQIGDAVDFARALHSRLCAGEPVAVDLAQTVELLARRIREGVAVIERSGDRPKSANSVSDWSPPAGSVVPADPGAPDGQSSVVIPPRANKAADQYKQAIRALGTEESTDREAYEHLEAAWNLAKARVQEDPVDKLPNFATWQRNLREYRRLTGTQKHRPRAGNAKTAGHFARPDQIEPKHWPAAIRPKSAD